MCVYVCLLVYIRSMLIMKTTYKSTECVYVCLRVSPCLYSFYANNENNVSGVCICVFTCVSLSIFALC